MMKTQTFIAILFCLLCLPFGRPARAQQIIVNPMPFLDGLSTNSIFTMYQDTRGFLWIGTACGLECYDGYDIQHFISNYKNPHQLTNNDVRCLAEGDEYLWVGTLRGITLINKDTYQSYPFPDSGLQNKAIIDLLRDRKGNIWATADQSAYQCDATKGILKEYTLGHHANYFYQDRDNALWLLTQNGGILKYDATADTFTEYARMEGCNPFRMTQDNQGRYWIVTWGSGIWRFDPSCTDRKRMFRRQTVINPVRHFPEEVFYDIAQDDTYGYIWALSHFRLYVFRVNGQGELEEVDINASPNINRPIDLSKTYSKIIKDRDGNLWLGAYDQSYTITFEKAEIENHTMANIKKQLGVDANILYFNKDSKGIIWCDQSRYGLCLFDEQNGQTTYGNNADTLYSIVVRTIAPSRKEDAVWLGGREVHSTRLWKMKQEQMRIYVLEKFDLRETTASPGEISQIVEDDYGNIWIGTSTHLFFKAKDSRTIEMLPLGISQITDMSKDSDGNVWVCCQEGICQMGYKGKPTLLKQYAPDALPLHEDRIKNISAAPHAVWFSTTLGKLFRLDVRKQHITEQTDSCGLQGDNILKLLSHANNLWIVCDKYIIRHTPGKNETYSVNDANIFVTSFRLGAAFIDEGGCLYAGGHNGFIKILPDSGNVKNCQPGQVFITDVKSDNRSVLFQPVGKENGNSIHEVTLLPHARNIEFRFSALNYTDGRKIKYAYRLMGEDKQWTYLENGEHTAFYNHLGKGIYTLQVKVTDPYGNWLNEPCSIRVHKLPAWYETWYTYLVYTLIAASLIYASFNAYFRRIARKNRLKLQEELTQIKLNYFTNISHELLTPLTLISCVTDDMEENKGNSDRQVEILRSNTNRLKRLLQQILDFRKVESGKMELNVSKSNLSSFISGIVASNFQPMAHKKDIRLMTRIEEGIWGYLDIDKLDKILFNLLSNAIKYTPEHKNIEVTANTVYKDGCRYLLLKVRDEGIGIAEKDLKHIFTKFYNTRNHAGYESNGIGLSLTKELITLHHGSIEVSSELGKGSLFSVEIPIDKEIYTEQELTDSIPVYPEENTEDSNPPARDNRPHILFVDDNAELCELIRNLFNKKYHILTAQSAAEGFELLKDNAIDIIICDVMMPQTNGLEFCRRIKGDTQTNHIPIIMLTAKNTEEDRIECYQAGAESYIAKPFEMKVLQARISNLLQKQELCQKSFRSRMEINIDNIDYKSYDEKFLTDAMQCVEKHIQDPDFDLDRMASELHISRSTLTRKCKVIAGCTPLDFIRNIKLKYACALLRNDKAGNISEVAYATGFSSAKYFTKCFKEEFGMTPTEYQNQQ